MTIDERARHKLHLAAERQLGTEEAATLMAMLPPAGWADVATKGDIDAQRAILTAQIDGLRTELRGEMGQLRTELWGEMATLRGEMGGLRHELTATFEARLGEVVRTLLLAIIGFTITTWAALAAVLVVR
jgi:hypothetical protein